MHISNGFKLWAMAVSIAGVAAVAACQETGPTERLTPSEPHPAVAQAARVVVTPDTLKLAPVGAQGTMTGRALTSGGAELSGVPLKWWQIGRVRYSRLDHLQEPLHRDIYEHGYWPYEGHRQRVRGDSGGYVLGRGQPKRISAATAAAAAPAWRQRHGGSCGRYGRLFLGGR